MVWFRLDLSKYDDKSVFKYYKFVKFYSASITDEKVSRVKDPYNMTMM